MLVSLLKVAALAALGVASVEATRSPLAALRQAAAPLALQDSSYIMPYKDTSINMNWNTNVISTSVTGGRTALLDDMKANGANAITFAFASGECGSESWGGVSGDALKSGNYDSLKASNVAFRISTGGAAGQFTCGSQSGFDQFVGRWTGANLVGVDFDIESTLSPDVLSQLVTRVKEGLQKYPSLTFSFTLATLATSPSGAHQATAFPQGQAPDSFSSIGDGVLNAISSGLGFQKGNPSSWPDRVRINLMVMDYGGSASNTLCVPNGSGSECDMGESGIQAAYNLRDVWGVPMKAIELTPMIGDNDASSEHFSLDDARNLVAKSKAEGIAMVHYWSYDRDAPCGGTQLGASPTCNSAAGAQPHSFLNAFMHAAQQVAKPRVVLTEA